MTVHGVPAQLGLAALAAVSVDGVENDDVGRGRLEAVDGVLNSLVPDTDPVVVFGQLARLCVPAVCDAVDVELLTGASAPRWDGRLVVDAADVGSSQFSGAEDPAVFTPGPAAVGTALGLRGRSDVTVWIPSGTDADGATSSAADSFVVGLTCRWSARQADPSDVALINLVGRYAAIVVAGERHRQALVDQLSLVENLHKALGTNRTIAAAVGILMVRHRLTQDSAFNLLRTVSHRSNRKIIELAESVVLTGELSA